MIGGYTAHSRNRKALRFFHEDPTCLQLVRSRRVQWRRPEILQIMQLRACPRCTGGP